MIIESGSKDAVAPSEQQGSSTGLCGARKKSGEPCKRRAGMGTEHVGYGPCRLHGGMLPTVVQAVEARIIEAKVRTLFGKAYDDKPVENPLAVYAEFTGKVMGWMQSLDALVHDLDSPRYANMTGEQIRGEVQLFERALDRCNNVLSTYAKLNIDERLARISEAQAFMVMQAIESALSAAGVFGARAIEAKKAAAKRLRIVEGATVPDTV